jgi:hypothetical protein
LQIIRPRPVPPRSPPVLGFGEIKTEMLERLETIRSKSPVAVAQEMWGLLLVYNLVRVEMERIADELNVAPTRNQLRCCTAVLRRVLVTGLQVVEPRGTPDATRESPRSRSQVRLTCSTPRPGLPPRGQAEDEQLRPQTAGWCLVEKGR